MMPVRESRSRMRVSMASARPTVRARGCSPAGSLPARIEMKMMLSMPRTISSTVSVRRAIQVSGALSQSMTKRTSSSGRRQTKTSRKTVIKARGEPRCKHTRHPLRLRNTLCEEPGIGRLHQGGTLIAPDESAVTAADRGSVSRQTSSVARGDPTCGRADRRLLVSLQCRHPPDHQLGPRLGVRDRFLGDAARVALRAVEARLPQTRFTRGRKSAARSEVERFDADALDAE